MSAIYPLQSTFNRGEISPLLASRVDVDFWRQSLAHCTNFQVLTHGGLRRRSGSRFIAQLKNSAQFARLFPFKFSETQAYVLVLNGGAIQFCALRGILGAPYEVGHPWISADLARLSYTQFNDVAYFAHKAYPPRKLSRKADLNWTIENVVFNDGPFLSPGAEGTGGTTLTPSGRGAISAIMTSNTTPSGVVASDDASANAYRAFDGKADTFYQKSGTFGSLTYTPASAVIADAYWIIGYSNIGNTPSNWTFQGYNGTDWIVLDSRQGETGWRRGDRRFYEFKNDTAYQAYRIVWEGVENTGDDPGSVIGEIGIHRKAEDQTPFSLTASSIAGINGGAGFKASDIGRAIRLRGSDGRWRWAKIAGYSSPTSVTIRLYQHAIPDLGPIADWQIGALSDESGWPGSVSLYDERLVWARTNAEPVSVFGSKQGIFDDYGVSEPVLPTDGLKITLLSSNMNELLWLADDEDLITGSASQIRSVGPADTTQSFSATNLTQRKGPTSGASYHQPLSIGGTVLYVGAGATKIRELVYGDQNRYVAPELTILGEHLFKSGIKDWAFAEKPDPTIWVTTGNGLLISITYDRDQKVLGFARHDLGGAVENVAVIPGTAGIDDVYIVVRRTINGSVVRYIEVLERPFDNDIDAIEDAFFVDCGLSYSGPEVQTISGLGHLEGCAVAVLADGGVVPDLSVSGGSITLPYKASKIHVGLPFTSRAETLPYAGPGQDGTLFGRRRTVTGASVDVLATGALKVGMLGSRDWSPPLTEQFMKQGDALFGLPIDLQTGFTPCEIEGSWAEGRGQIVMETSEPLPALIRALALQVEGEP